MWKKPLICMFKATFDPGLLFPEDGVCDLSFFGALEQKDAFLKDEGGEYNASLDAFLAAAGKQHRPNTESASTTPEVLKDPISKETVKKLWGKKIYHWGFLTTDVYRVTEVNMTLLFEILKNLNDTTFYITVTMATKRYIPDENYAYKAEMLPSKETLEVPIMNYCKNMNYEFGFQESEPIAPYYVSQKEGRFISFDDSRSLGIKDIPVDQFLRNGIPAVPVALVPSNDGFIRMKNPKVIQAELRAVTSHFHSITEVRQFGRGGVLCFSSDQLCIQDLLKCSSFATNPVLELNVTSQLRVDVTLLSHASLTVTPMWKKPLICMFTATFDPGLVFPEDGVCDLSFFGALEQKHAFLKDEGGEYNAALDAFLAAAGKQHKTEHGVSLDHS
ncbi:hypothetical protein HPB51_028762 [Rhipicephalus microplus]|uniref:Uncharacterized protein n=1 Tax=Rhipicephalus microplus TaxID=6941 RepID=A0A9J6CW18_RHIMP|nr:hypothetical protein HPB51_028762 [Rhipicephalus microplus]